MKKVLCICVLLAFILMNRSDIMALTKPTYAVDNIQGLADIVQGQGTAVKVLHDKTGADTKTFLEGMCDELDVKFSIPEGGAAAMAVEAYNGLNSHKANLTKVFINAADPPSPLVAAVCNGIANDTAAIQAIVNYAPVNTVVVIPNKCLVDSIVISGKSYLTITGGELIKSATTTDLLGVIYINNSHDIKINGMTLKGKNVTGADVGLWISASYNVTIKNNKIYNFFDMGIVAYNANQATEIVNHIYDNYIYDNGIGISLQGDAEYWKISRNDIIGNTTGVQGSFSNTRLDNNTITGNVIGVDLDGSLGVNSDHSSISGNVINHNTSVGMIVRNLVNGEQIIDNQMLSNGDVAWAPTGASHSLVMLTVKDISFMGNRVDGGAGGSVHISGYENCRFIGNTFLTGDVDEAQAGSNNYWIGNHFIDTSRLVLHAASTNTIKIGNQEAGIFCGDATAIANKNLVTVFANSWVNHDATSEPLSYWKDGEGCIHVQGVVKSGDIGTTIFTLPANYRPLKIIDFACTANNTGDHAAIRVYPDGQAQHLSGGNTMVSLSFMFKP